MPRKITAEHAERIKRLGFGNTVPDMNGIVAESEAMTKTTETRAEPPLSLSVQKRQHVQRGGKMSDFDHKAASEKLAALSSVEDSALLRGAMNAQDERERKAGELCGVPYDQHGCDWPDAVAEKLIATEAELARAKEALRLQEEAYVSMQKQMIRWRERAQEAERLLSEARKESK